MLESLTRASQKRYRSREHVVETERRGREYYLCPTLDALEATLTPRQWGEQRGALFENNLAQLESFVVTIGFYTYSVLSWTT